MRKIEKGTIPVILNSLRCKNSLRNVINTRRVPVNGVSVTEISDNWYRGSRNNAMSVVSCLNLLYKNKCAYCESERTELDVDHYRPKSAVADENHTGYYWLSYDWHNLIYVCKECNRDYKRTEFPIVGTRVTDQSFVDYADYIGNSFISFQQLNDKEQPLLLNPEETDFDPHKYFKFKSDGSIEGYDVTKGRGQKTIEICELNRFDLKRARNKELYDFRVRVMAKTIMVWERTKDKELVKDCLFIDLSNIKKDADEEFTAFWEQVYNRFSELVLNKLGDGGTESGFLLLLKEVFQKVFQQDIANGKIPDFMQNSPLTSPSR